MVLPHVFCHVSLASINLSDFPKRNK